MIASSNEPEQSPSSRHSLWGTSGLLLGAILFCLALVDDTAGLPFSMPRSWYVNRSIWYLIAVSGFVSGYYLLRSSPPISSNWQPAHKGVRFDRVVLYTRSECHLCDHAKDTLLKYRKYLPEIEEIDIDSDPHLVSQFCECVPVVEIDSKVRFRGTVNELLLRRLIDGSTTSATESPRVA